ncbi:MAG TPA: hypothetical protein VGN80_17275 [Devosiaceae bacterium]|jgi:hypothetical protein|nr:hypothetical protein [Devosiaceae bacterium]
MTDVPTGQDSVQAEALSPSPSPSNVDLESWEHDRDRRALAQIHNELVTFATMRSGLTPRQYFDLGHVLGGFFETYENGLFELAHETLESVAAAFDAAGIYYGRAVPLIELAAKITEYRCETA